MQKATLNKWALIGDWNPYLAPELRVSRLYGEVWNHPKFADGHKVTTSSIRGKDKEDNIITQNTVYILGEVDPEYEKLFPNAKERILKHLSLRIDL